MQRVNTRRRGFTITEVTVCMIIIAVLSFLSLSTRIAEQSGMAEAEKLYTWLTRMTQKASRMRRGFTLYIYGKTDNVYIKWNNDIEKNITYPITPGCKVESTSNRQEIAYKASNNSFEGSNATITVFGNGKEESKYYLKLSKTGRIRTTDDKDDND